MFVLRRKNKDLVILTPNSGSKAGRMEEGGLGGGMDGLTRSGVYKEEAGGREACGGLVGLGWVGSLGWLSESRARMKRPD